MLARHHLALMLTIGAAIILLALALAMEPSPVHGLIF